MAPTDAGQKAYFEDYHRGEVLRSNARTITEADVVLYSMFSGDWDRRTTDTGIRVPEMFAFSVGLCLLLTVGQSAWIPLSFIAFYGFDRIDFRDEVEVGDTLHSTATVADMIERDEQRGIVVYDHETTNQHGAVVLSSRHRVLLFRRGVSETPPGDR